MSGDKIICAGGKVPLVPFLAEGRTTLQEACLGGELLRKARVYLCKLIGLRLQASSRRHEENPC